MVIIRVPKKASEKKTHVEVKKSENALIKDLKSLGFFKLNGEENFTRVRKCMPTGLPGLDVICARDANGVYGLPFGRQIEISGKPDSGKTSLMLHLAAQAQSLGYIAVWIETEDTLNEERAVALGANPEELMLENPDYLERVLALIKKTVLLVPKYGEKGYDPEQGLVIFWDSVAATPTKEEFEPKRKPGQAADASGEREFSSSNAIAEFARLMARYQRKIKKRLSSRNVMIVYCNQLKDKIGVTWGDKTQTYGGNALRFHSTIRIKVSYTGKIRFTSGLYKGDACGITMKFENKKNKCLPPWGVVDGLEFDFIKGFNRKQSLLHALEHKKIAKKSGTTYKVSTLDTKMKFTWKEFCKYVDKHPWLEEKLLEGIYVSR